MVLVVSNTPQYSFGRIALLRAGVLAQIIGIVEGVLRHISKRRQRHPLLEIMIDTARHSVVRLSQTTPPSQWFPL